MISTPAYQQYRVTGDQKPLNILKEVERKLSENSRKQIADSHGNMTDLQMNIFIRIQESLKRNKHSTKIRQNYTASQTPTAAKSKADF